MTEQPISEIVVPDRHRRELGDLEPLMESIREVGLLHPIVVRSDGTLIAGQRRLESFRRLGYDTIPVNFAVTLDTARAYLMAERDENVCRLDMTPSEKVSLGRALEELERPRAKARRNNLPNAERKSFPDSGERAGKVYDLVGESVGMSGPTYKRAKAVVAAAEDGDPVAIVARDQMDATGKVTPAYDKVNGHAANGNGHAKTFTLRPGRNADIANTNKSRVWHVVNALDGLATGLSSINLPAAFAVTDTAEVDEMTRLLGKSLADLRRFRAALNEGRNDA